MELSSLIGIESIKKRARIQIQACLVSHKTFPHSMIFGLGGIGKTLVARSIADELNYYFFEIHAAVFRKPETLTDSLIFHSKEASKKRIPLLYFIDEIHRLSLPLQEALYSPMKEWWVPSLTGRVEVKPFTLFGATTRFEMLDANSFVTRFGNVWEVKRYEPIDMAIIIAQALSKQGFNFSKEVSQAIASRCLGIPRTGVNLAEKVGSSVLARGSKTITMQDVSQMFELEGIDMIGLRTIHHQYLRVLESNNIGGKIIPVGVKVIAAKMRQAEETITGMVEPELLEFEFIMPTSRGRTLTDKGVHYLESLPVRGRA
jgi:holliday junction DNA helicase RuvB